MDKLQWTAWSRDWNTDLQEHKDLYIQEFGADINEYGGYCRNAFSDIGISYGDTFILWQLYDSFLENRATQDELDTKKAQLRSALDDAQTALEACWKGL